MKKNITHLATRIFNTPLLIHPRKADTILRVLGPRIGLTQFAPIPKAYWDSGDDDDFDEPMAETPYEVEGGIAVISISGTLVKRSSGMDGWSGLTSYESLSEEVEQAFADPNVKAVVYDVDSPGGEAAGMSDLSDLIYSMRGKKPMIAVSNDSMYSAAYGIACAADEVYVTRDGGAGSIGCYMLHCDQSGYDKEMGLKYDYIFAGDHKVDGNPHEPLAAPVRAELQAEVDRCRDMFVSLVARNRNVTAEQVLNTQAACFYAEQAVPLLADKVGSLQDAMVALGMDTAEPETAEPEQPEEESILFDMRAHERVNISSLMAMAKHTGFSEIKFGRKKSGKSNPILAIRLGSKAQSAATEITGIVAPYGESSVDLGGFVEVYESGCFSESLKSADPRILFNHNPDFVLGRKTASTAQFIDGPEGLSYTANPPDTQWARDLTTSMTRGDITQSSAAFYILKHRWEMRGGQKTRVIEKAELVEASVVSFAAYESAQASVQPASLAALHDNELLGARLQLLKVS